MALRSKKGAKNHKIFAFFVLRSGEFCGSDESGPIWAYVQRTLRERCVMGLYYTSN